MALTADQRKAMFVKKKQPEFSIVHDKRLGRFEVIHEGRVVASRFSLEQAEKDRLFFIKDLKK